MPAPRALCYVIMPFSKTTNDRDESYWTSHFDRFLKPLIEENPELEARKSQAIRQDIIRQIVADLVTAPIVVADLTDKNANVYWELGVRQSFKHGTITIVDHRSDLSFDLSTKGTLKYYPDDHIKNEEFRSSFRKALADCLSHPKKPDSIVLESVSGRGSLYEIFHRDEAIRRLQAFLAEIWTNQVMFEVAVNTAKKYAQEKRVPTGRLRVSAAELLLTDRYLEEDSAFYKDIGKYYDESVRLNEQFSAWDVYAGNVHQSVPDWLIKYENNYRVLMDKNLNLIQVALDKLAHQL